MSETEAKIKVTVLADEAKRAAADLKRDWKDTATTIANAWRSVASAAGSAAQQTLASVGRIATAADLVSFDKAISSTLAFNESVGKTAVASGRSLDTLRDRFSKIGVKILETPQHVAAAAKALNRHTYDLDKSAAALEVVGGQGLFTDRSIDDLGEFAKLLAMGASNANDMAKQLDKVRGVSDKLGTKGKSTAVVDWANQNAGTLSRMTGSLSKGARADAMAIRAAMPKDLSPEMADEAAGSLVSSMVQNPRAWERSVGMKWGEATDKYGRLKISPLELIRRSQKRVMGLAGGDAEMARGIAQSTLGNLAGGALMGIDTAKVQRAAAEAEATARTPDMLADSPELREARTRAKADAALLNMGAGTVKATGGAREWSAEHPWLAGIGGSASNLVSRFGGDAVTAGLTLAGGKALGMFGGAGGAAGAAAAGKGMITLGALGTGAAAAIAGGAGYAWGRVADDQFNLSDYYSGGDVSLDPKSVGAQELTPEILAQFGMAKPAQDMAALPSAIGDAVAVAFERAARGEKVSIVVHNYTGGPIEAVEEDAAAAAGQ